jgi:RHS repeat-associated protein
MLNIKSLCLILLGAVLATIAHAQQSTITIQWSYAGTVYPNRAAAVAAMQAASAPNSVLTLQGGVTTISQGQVQYKYVAPSPLPYSNGSTVYFDGNTTETTEAAAVLEEETHPYGQLYQNGCGTGWSTPSSDWVYSANLGSPSYGPGYTRSYDLTGWVWNQYATPQCSLHDWGNQIYVSKYQVAGCPQYYTLSGSNCINNSVDYVYSTELTCQKPSTLAGDPCDAASGEFTQTETDYSGPTLTLTRYYHSATLESFHGMGVGWTHNYAAQLILNNGVPMALLRPDGHHDALILESGTTYVSLSGADLHVKATSPNWAVYMPDGSTEIYGSTGSLIELVSPGGAITTLNYTSGLLTSVVGPFGHTLQFGYNTAGLIGTITDPANNIITYNYDGNGNPASVLYSDGTTRYYQFTNSAFPNNLMGILDESGTQFLTVGYDSNGRASSSQNAGGANAVSLVFNSTSATVTDGLGGTTVFGFVAPANYSPRVTSVVHNGLTTGYVVPAPNVDPQQRATQTTDANGNATQFAYDVDHMTSKVEAYGTARTRTTGYQYLSTLSALPTLITEPLKQTAYQYYAGTNNVQTKTITDTTVTPNVSRIWTYTYNSYGQVLTVDGPRTDVSDVTTYTYYTCTTGTQCGQINTVSNALGQITTYNSYNAHGQPLTITDPNGVVTTLIYDARQRLRSRQVGADTTGYTYYPTGLLQTVTLPDSSTVTYAYDGAHRLTDITDGLGNHTHYVLDAMGNRATENSYDPSNVLHRTHTRVINTLNQLYQDVNAAGTAAVTTTYDSNGNQTSVAAPLSRNTSSQYDELNRTKQITDPSSGITQFAYDANDKVTSAIDPRSLSTIYTNNGFGDVTQLVSPDTGTTINTFDSGGNLQTTTDARGAVGTYSYDALNRVTRIVYTDQTINFTYDTGTNGKGRLIGASDANHSMGWAYDALGRVTGKSQTLGTVTKSVGYGYTNGDVTSLVTPSGQTITYGYTNHRITSISVNGTTLLSGVTYDPFGPVNGWTWGNNTSTVTRTYDTDGNITQINTAADPINFGYDNAFRITGITDTTTSANSWTLGYDLMDRLSSFSKTGAWNVWTYDANGSRLTQTGSQPSTFTPSTTSNRLSSTSGTLVRTYGYDAAGNTTSFANQSLTYNNGGRLVSDTVGASGSTYVYNALGQMIQYNFSTSGSTMIYDEAGHRLGEYLASSGALQQETIWLGDIPVATLRPNGTTSCTSTICIFYVHTDQLGAPRKITRPSDNGLLWRWDPNPFGVTSPNTNPAGLGTFTYSLRFPGQYFTQNSGIYNNGFRDYDQNTGAYIESDPIGLAGGSYSTYTYVNDNPVSLTDPLGLTTTVTVRCGRLPSVMGGSSGGRHCEVVATCDKTGESVAFGIGGGGNGIWQRLFGGKIPPKYQNPAEPEPGAGVREYSASCGDDDGCGCDTLKCFKKMQTGNTPPPYYALSQNSNSYAHALLGQCGCSLSNRPSGAVAW